MDVGVDLEASMPLGSKQEPVATPASEPRQSPDVSPSTGIPVVFKVCPCQSATKCNISYLNADSGLQLQHAAESH